MWSMDVFVKNKSIWDNPYFLMGILLFFWGSFASVSKLTLGKLDSFQVLFFMFGFALLIMTVILIVTGKYKAMKAISSLNYLKLVAFGLPQFFYYFLYMLSLKMIPTVEASAINYLFPIFIVLFAVPIHGEKINTLKILSLIIGFAGVFVIITGGNISSFKLSNVSGDIIALGAAISWGLFSNLGKKNKIDSIISNYIYTITAFILSGIVMLCYSSYIIPETKSLIGVFWLCISNIILTYYIWFRVLRIASPTLAANLSFFTPFITLVFIIALNGERITFGQLAGLMIIIFGTAIQNEHFIITLRRCIKYFIGVFMFIFQRRKSRLTK